MSKLAVHQNGEEFHQQFNSASRTSLTASYDNTTYGVVLHPQEIIYTGRDTRHRQPRAKQII